MKTITVNGRTLGYSDTGGGKDAPAIVLIHGFPLHGGVWSAVSAALSDTYRVIVPDLRGFGKSGPVTEVSLMSDFADDVLGLVDGLGLNKVTVFGHSMGGYVALDLARRFPQRLAGLGLVSTRPGPDSAEAAEKRAATARKVEAEGAGFLVADMSSKLLAAANRQPALIEKVKSFMEPASPKGIAAALLGMARRADMSPVLTSFTGPVLVITGDADELIPDKESRAMAESLKRGQLIVVPGTGHLVSLEKPAEFLSAVRHWLAKVK